MAAPPRIIGLVERFRDHDAAYLSANHNETSLRDDFLDPLFTELGWDLNNTAGYAQAYRDVVKEESYHPPYAVTVSAQAREAIDRIVSGAEAFQASQQAPTIASSVS